MSADVITRSGHVNSVRVTGRMLFASFVSRIAPPSVGFTRGGSTTTEMGTLVSTLPAGVQ